jgi:hypothetical protein
MYNSAQWITHVKIEEMLFTPKDGLVCESEEAEAVFRAMCAGMTIEFVSTAMPMRATCAARNRVARPS